MEQHQQSLLTEYRKDWADDLDRLRQNNLLDEASLITFAGERGIQLAGVITGEPGEFHRRGWLEEDGEGYRGKPLFHPFRIYPLNRLLYRESLRSAFGGVGIGTKDNDTAKDAIGWNDVANLAILLEPVYWPDIVGERIFRGAPNTGDPGALFQDYRKKASELIKSIDPDAWKSVHAQIRREVASLDDNPDLYVLLRVSRWESRKSLKGAISGALWIRHMAEIIRRGFEQAHSVRWPEEYESFAEWFPTGRELTFGSDRPLDDVLETRPYAAFNFGLSTGSSVRWYVEGETEYYCLLELLKDPPKLGIELLNLRGVLATERDNIALKLGDWLKEDRALRRFSVISFDPDVPANLKAIQRHVENLSVVGHIAAHKPDFEIANFTPVELAEIAAGLDEAHEFSGTALRSADWSDVTSAGTFEAQYRKLSLRMRGALKGEEWGRALARHADAHPRRSDTAEMRPLWKDLEATMRCRIAHYDIEAEYFGFDRNTFARIRRKPYPPFIAGN